jgi:hypothetical protein
MWREHLGGHGDWQHHIWAALMFQAWNEEWRRDPASAPPERLAAAIR